MARQAASQSLKSVAGASLCALGLVILFANLDGVGTSLSDIAGISAHEGMGVFPALGLAGLHALRAYAFDPAGFLSGFLQILVSFWPLVLIFAGAVVLHGARGRRLATYPNPSGSSTAGDQ